MAETRDSRSKAVHDLIGIESPQFEPRKLPTGGDILRELQWKISRDNKTKIDKMILCSMSRSTRMPKCEEDCLKKCDSDPD